MSLDIYLLKPDKCPHCGGALPTGSEIFTQNYTHNVTPMWSKANVYNALYMSKGWIVDEKYLQTIRDGIKAMESNAHEYTALNPANGWGSYDTALEWLRKWLSQCEQNIGAQIHVSK